MVKKIVCILALILCIGAAAGAVVSAKRVSSGANIPYAYELQDDIANEGKIAKIDIVSSFTTFNDVMLPGAAMISAITDVDGTYHLSLAYARYEGEIEDLLRHVSETRKNKDTWITLDEPITVYGVMKRPFDGASDNEGDVIPKDATEEMYSQLQDYARISLLTYRADPNLDKDQIDGFYDDDWSGKLGINIIGTAPPKEKPILSLVLIVISTLSFVAFVVSLLLMKGTSE